MCGANSATDGAAELFADLAPQVAWQTGRLQVDCELDDDVYVAGRGLPLMPSIFPRHAVMVLDPDLPPVLTYPARGRATLTERPDVPPRRLAALLGRTRAQLLLEVANRRARRSSPAGTS